MGTGTRPDPATALSAPDFLEHLRRLHAWAGEPSLRTLSSLAGKRPVPGGGTVDALPVTTLSDNLSGKRSRLPRRAYVKAFVAACLRCREWPEEDIEAEVEQWRLALRRLEHGDAPLAPAGTGPSGNGAKPANAANAANAATPATAPVPTEPAPTGNAAEDTPADPPWWRDPRVATPGRKRLALAVAAVVVAMTAMAATSALLPTTPTSTATGATGAKASETPRRPEAGAHRIRSMQIPGSCLGSFPDAQRNREVVEHRPCDRGFEPAHLVPVGENFRLEWRRSGAAPLCLGIENASVSEFDALIALPCAANAADTAAHQRFRAVPYDGTPGSFQLRPVHSGMCLSVEGRTPDGTWIVQRACTDKPSRAFVLETT